MKSLLVILSYIGTAVMFYLILAAIGFAFTNYTWNECITCGPFQFFYLVLIHWIPALMVADEVNDSLGQPLN